jgi:hypothetical protein
MMLPLATKQSGGKLLPHSDLRGGVFLGEASRMDGWRRLVSAVMNLRVPQNAGNFLTSCKPLSFSRRSLHHGVSKYWVALFEDCMCKVYMITSTKLRGSKTFGANCSLFSFIIFEFYVQKDLKLQKSFEPNFVPTFKTTLHNPAAQRSGTNGSYVGNLAKGNLCNVQLN